MILGEISRRAGDSLFSGPGPEKQGGITSPRRHMAKPDVESS